MTLAVEDRAVDDGRGIAGQKILDRLIALAVEGREEEDQRREDDAARERFEDLAAEQKARKTYDNLLRLIKDPDVADPIRFLRAREIVHFQRFGEAMRTYAKDFHQTLELEKSLKKKYIFTV